MNIFITNLQHKIPIPVPRIRTAAHKAAAKLKLKRPDLSIVFTGQKRMRTINRTYLGHDYATDVITFDYGEIFICPAVAEHNAKQYGNSVAAELLLYVIHGLLHLAGYDDHSAQDAKKMRIMEQKLLSL